MILHSIESNFLSGFHPVAISLALLSKVFECENEIIFRNM